jgi:hypothetical protein
MNEFVQKLLDDIHNINPELALKRQTEYNQNIVNKALNEQCDIHVVSSSLPDLAECNQASLDYATKKDNPDFFLIKQTFKEGINWALNYMTKNK